jgi:hypothetical protein
MSIDATSIAGWTGDFRVVDRPRAECAWVFDGEGDPTESPDGANLRLTVRAGQLVRDFLAGLESRFAPGALAEGIVFGGFRRDLT